MNMKSETSSNFVFISYAKRDVKQAKAIYDVLTSGGVSCWMDKENLRIGDDWQQEITEAIQACEMFLACLSKQAVDHRGFFQTELRTAYEAWKRVPSGRSYLAPVRLDDCEVPAEIERVHYVDFFAADGPGRLRRDVLDRIAPGLPAARLREALEHIRLGRLDEAHSILLELKKAVDDGNPDLRLRTLYDISCVHSLAAERLTTRARERAQQLDKAVEHLRQWFKLGKRGAWASTGRTAENEIYRLGGDADLRCVLAARRSDITSIFGKLASALPAKPPQRPNRGGGIGGCLLLSHRISTPNGLIAMGEVRPGTELTSYLADGSAISARALRTYSTRHTECVVINRTIMVTASQSLFEATNRPIRARDLQRGVCLRAPDGRSLLVESIDRVRGHFEVATLTTDDPTHNFACPELVYGNAKYK